MKMKPQEQRVWDAHFKLGVASERLAMARTDREKRKALDMEDTWSIKAANIFRKEYKALCPSPDWPDHEARQARLQDIADNAIQAGAESVRSKVRTR